MVKPAFLSKEHYQHQVYELQVCVELVERILQVLENSLCAARRLGLKGDAALLESVCPELKAASENLDSAICYLDVLERKL